MSLGIVIKGPEGLVLAAESRVTLTASSNNGTLHVNFDNATKLLSFSHPNTSIGVVTYGQAAIGLRSAHSFVPEFEASLPDKRLTVLDFSLKFSNFMMDQWQRTITSEYNGPDMTFIIAGFDDGEPYGKVYEIRIPRRPDPIEQNPGDNQFGITWGGQREFVDRLIRGFDIRAIDIARSILNLNTSQVDNLIKALETLHMQIPLPAMPLQDCVNMAIFFIRTTIDAQLLTVGIRGCGGPIDVATITRSQGLKFVQKKEIIGQR